MKLYYTSSIRLNQQNQEISEMIKKAALGMRYEFSSVYSQFVNVDEYSKLNDESAFSIFRKAQKALKESDVLVAEVSHPSDRIGYEVATALADKKPVLAFLRSDAKLAPPIQGNKSKYLTVARYKDEAEAEKMVTEFLKEAKKKIDTKFILIISPQIDRYLEWASQENRMHKAQIVRDSIEQMMNKDGTYKQYMKSQLEEDDK